MGVSQTAGFLREAIEVQLRAPTPGGAPVVLTELKLPNPVSAQDAEELGNALRGLEADAAPSEGTDVALRDALRTQAGREGLIAAIGWRVEDRLAVRETDRDRRINKFVTVVGVLLAAGLAAVGFLAKVYIEGKLKADVDVAEQDLRSEMEQAKLAMRTDLAHDVDEKIQVRFGNELQPMIAASLSDTYEGERAFASLSYLATLLELKSGFPQRDADATIAALQTLQHERHVALRRRPEFSTLLSAVVTAFTQTGRHDLVTRVANLYESECLADSGLTIRLLEHYGEYLAGRLDSPSAWPEEDTRRFDVFCSTMLNTSKDDMAKVPSIVYSLLIGFRQHGEVRHEAETRLFRSALLLTTDPERDTRFTPKLRLCEVLLHSTHTVFLGTDSSDNLEQVRTGQALLDTYMADFGRLLVSVGTEGREALLNELADDVTTSRRSQRLTTEAARDALVKTVMKQLTDRIEMSVAAAQSNREVPNLP